MYDDRLNYTLKLGLIIELNQVFLSFEFNSSLYNNYLIMPRN